MFSNGFSSKSNGLIILFVLFSIFFHADNAVKNRTRPEKCILDFSRSGDDKTYVEQSQ
jgi:hypothetical protein